MRPRFQADENLNAKIIAGVLRRDTPGTVITFSRAHNLAEDHLITVAKTW